MKAIYAIVLKLSCYLTNASLIYPENSAMPEGIDVSSHQPNVNWETVKSSGVTFAFIKATEGHSGSGLLGIYTQVLIPPPRAAYTSPTFSSQYTGATNAGLIRGGYHFAHPDSSSGATQAEFFVANGGKGDNSDDDGVLIDCTFQGGWSADGERSNKQAPHPPKMLIVHMS